MDKKVTIIMSAYNHEDYIESAIRSVLNQTYKNYKFIVADDASTDHTAEILMKYENSIDEIHLYDKNSGHGRGREFILQVDTEYTAIISSDDFWEQQKLERQIDYMEQHPECGACFTWCDEIDENGRLLDNQVFCVNNRSKEEWMLYFWKNGNCLAHPSILIRTEIYKELCRENINVFKQLPDFFMWIRLIQKWEIHIIEESLVNFRHHVKNQNVSASTSVNRVRNDMEAEYIWYKIMKKMESNFFKKAFQSTMINPNVKSEEEIVCEKYFAMCISPLEAVQSASVLYYYDVFENKDNYQALQEKYQYGNREFYIKEMQIGKGKKQVDLMKENDELIKLMNQLLTNARGKTN